MRGPLLSRRDVLTSALLSNWALAAGRDGGATPPRVAFPHGRPVVSFATSPDGRFLVTGAEASDLHADDAVEGVSCWDLSTLKPTWTTHLTGGVGLSDQLKGGLQFSPDGRHVGANFHQNALAVLDAATGAVRKEWTPTNDDSAVNWCWSADPAWPDTIVMAANGQLVFASPLTGAERVAGPATGRPVAADAQGVVLLNRDAISRGQQRVPLKTKNGSRALCWAVTNTTIAVGTEPGELLVLDRKTFAVRYRLALTCQGLASSASGDVVAVRTWPSDAVVVRRGRLELIPWPVVAPDWQAFADAVPVASSPDGRRTAALAPTGEVFELSLAPPPLAGPPSRRLLGVVSGALGLTWPRADRLVALGPRVVAVIEPGAGVRLESRLT